MSDTEYVSPYVTAGMNGICDWFKLEWAKYVPDKTRSMDTAILGNIADMRKQKDVTKEIQNPRMNICFARMELHAERGGGAKRFHVTTTAINVKTGRATTRRLVPVRLGFLTNFITDNADEVKIFTEMVLNNYPGPSLFFEDNTGFRVECRVNFDSGMDFPQSDISGPGDLYTLEPVVSMTTYIGEKTEMGLIRQIDVRFGNAVGPIGTSVGYDVSQKKFVPLEEKIINYTDSFDNKSSQWKGI